MENLSFPGGWYAYEPTTRRSVETVFLIATRASLGDVIQGEQRCAVIHPLRWTTS